METEVDSVTITYQDIFDFVIKWDKVVSDKIKKEGKMIQLCKILSSISDLVNALLLYKSLDKVNNETSYQIYYWNSYIKNVLSHIILGIPRPIHETELYDDEQKINWKSTNYWTYNILYHKTHQNFIKNPININNIKYKPIELIYQEYDKNELDDMWENLIF